MLRLGTKVNPKAVGCVGENKVIGIFNVVTISDCGRKICCVVWSNGVYLNYGRDTHLHSSYVK